MIKNNSEHTFIFLKIPVRALCLMLQRLNQLASRGIGIASVFFSLTLLSKLSWLNVFSDLIRFSTLSSKLFSYKSYILFQSLVHLLTLWQKLYFRLRNSALLPTLWKTFCGSVERSFKKVKRQIIRWSVCCFIWSIKTNSLLQSIIWLYSK